MGWNDAPDEEGDPVSNSNETLECEEVPDLVDGKPEEGESSNPEQDE